MNENVLFSWQVNIGSGHGLVPSGNKPLLEAVLTVLCRHMASLGHNELNVFTFRGDIAIPITVMAGRAWEMGCLVI